MIARVKVCIYSLLEETDVGGRCWTYHCGKAYTREGRQEGMLQKFVKQSGIV